MVFWCYGILEVDRFEKLIQLKESPKRQYP